MQKHLSILEAALIADKPDFLIASALIAAFTTGKLLNKKLKDKPLLPRIGLDLLGSDSDSAYILESALPILESMKDRASFFIFGEEKNREVLRSIPFISYEIASETITMTDNPLWAVRRKKNSSLLLGILALKNKRIDAFISMGNTGALITSSRAELKTLPFIKRPALLALLPTKKNKIAVLDVGANTECKSSHLIDFAAMGIAYQKIRGIENPTVGLLNIGIEELKGTPMLRDAYQTLSALSKKHKYPFFQGNIEGRDAFEGNIDVLITDGFTGNIFLKTSEGIADFLLDQIKTHNSPLSESKTLEILQNRLNSSEHSGATLAGANGIVIKCHGNAKPKALQHSLKNAIELLEQNFLEQIKLEILSFFGSSC